MRINIEHRLRIYKPRFITKSWFSALNSMTSVLWKKDSSLGFAFDDLELHKK